MEFKRCPSCRGPLQPFRPLTGKEKEFVRTQKSGFAPEAYIRCTREGCRRYQRSFNWNDGGYFPEPEPA
jgi:hypothetical protein